jgi:hypothetical protein
MHHEILRTPSPNPRTLFFYCIKTCRGCDEVYMYLFPRERKERLTETQPHSLAATDPARIHADAKCLIGLAKEEIGIRSYLQMLLL